MLCLVWQTHAQQSVVTVNYMGESIVVTQFDEISGHNRSGDVISAYARELPLPPLDALSDNVPYKKGHLLMIEVDLLRPAPFPINSQDTLGALNWSSRQEALAEEAAVKRQVAAIDGEDMKAQQARLQAETQKINDQMKALTKRIQAGDMSVLAEIEALTDRAAALAEQGVAALPPLEEYTARNHFDVLLQIPYQGGKYAKEVHTERGRLHITYLDEREMKATFEIDAVTFADEWDKEARSADEARNDQKNFGSVFLEAGKVTGTIHLYFEEFDR